MFVWRISRKGLSPGFLFSFYKFGKSSMPKTSKLEVAESVSFHSHFKERFQFRFQFQIKIKIQFQLQIMLQMLHIIHMLHMLHTMG